MKYLKIVLLACIAAFVSCSQDQLMPEPEVPTTPATGYVYTLNLDTPAESRAIYPFTDGDMLYITFVTASGNVPAWARYIADCSNWELHTASPLTDNEYGTATIAYFWHDIREETFEPFAVGSDNMFFCARDVDFMLNESIVKIKAVLQPQGVRMRFRKQEAAATDINIAGLNTYLNWYPAEGSITSQSYESENLQLNENEYVVESVVMSPYRSVFLVNSNPQNQSLNCFKVRIGRSLMIYPYQEYKAMFVTGSVATVDLSVAKYIVSYSGEKTLSTAIELVNETAGVIKTSIEALSISCTGGGIHLKGKLRINHRYGDNSSFRIIVQDSEGSQAYCSKSLPVEEGATSEFDMNFCYSENISSRLGYYVFVEYSGIDCTILEATASNF